jgi:acetoin utilization deacetylase AcuC-like enzyme
MDVTRRIGVIEDPRFQNHTAPEGHPEAPARLLAVGDALSAWEQRSPGTLLRIKPRLASDDEILSVHTRDHLRKVEAAVARAPTRLDADTFVSADSLDVARLAVGSCVELATKIALGELDTGFAALRPPGHHAEADHAMGFCLFNSVAVAARALQQTCGIEKVLIIDWDVHHGNGSQHSFEDDPSVLYLSTHQFPFYPGTGAAGEAGIDRGRGTTVNIPMPPGCGDYEYIGVLTRLFAPIAREFDPDFMLVSCGFDAHHADPLGSMEITAAGFLSMTQITQEVAATVCGGRIAYFLEGGYSPQGLAEGTAAVLDGMAASDLETVALGDPATPPEGSNLHQLVGLVSQVHSGTYSSLNPRRSVHA